MSDLIYPGRLGLQQRVLPDYRAPFFEHLARSCAGGFSLFAGTPRPMEAIKTADRLAVGELFLTENRHSLGGLFYRCYQPGLIDWLESWQPDALVVEANPRYPDTLKAIRWMHDHNRPVLGWGLGAPPISGWLAGARRQARFNFLSQLDGVIAYSQRGAQQYRALGLPAGRVFVAHNAAVPPPVGPPPERPETVERAVALFVGRLQARKHLELLFAACASLPRDIQPELLVVGDGPAKDHYKMQAGILYPRTKFVGAKHGEELAPYFTRADLFVLPGTGGLAVQQAMSYGLPVIVAQGDGTQDDLVRPENGWLIPPDDQDQLKTVLFEALADVPRLRKMGAASYRITAEEINLVQMAASFVEALNQVSRAG